MDDWKTPCVVDIACPIVVWLRDTYRLDPEGRVAKDEVYAQYQLVAERKGWPLKRNSDFGKVVKKAFPDVASRRLGSAGKQVAHYSGISLADSRSTTSPTVQCAAQRSCASTPPRSQTQQTRSSPHLHRKTITPRTPSSDASSQEDSDYSPYEAYESPTRGRKRPAPRKRRSAKDEDEEAEDGSDDEYNADEDDGTYTFIRRQPRGRNNRKGNPQPRSLDFARPRKRVKQENFSDEVQQPSVNLSPRPSMIPHGHLLSVTPMSNPHSSTDAFFSSSATPTSNIPMYHNNNTNSLPPSDSHHGVVDEYAEGNDQSPLLQSRTMRRPSGEDMMLPLLPPYVGAETSLTNIQFPGRESVVGMEKGFPENLDDEYDGYSFALDYQPLCYSFAPSESAEREVFSPLKPGASLEIDRKFVQSALDTFHSVMWPYVPLPASVFSEQSVNWFINEGRQRNTRLTLFIETALYYASASIGDIPQAQEIFKCLMMMVPYFYQQNDLNVALVLATLSTCTFSWYEKEEALKFSREFLDAAINMCVNLRQQNSEVYHMCLDIRSWIETGRLTPSLHARFPLHANEYPSFLMPCRVAIKQCLHLVTMVRHIVFILEHAPKGTVLPPSARADVDEKLMMLKTCFNAMSAPVMDGHPFIANYLKLQLVGSMAELRWALGDRNKAITKAIQFVDLCRDIFPFVDVVFYASRVFGILLEANTVEHAKGLMGAFNDVKFTSLKDVSSFLRSCTKRLRNHEKASLTAAAAPSAPDTQTYFQC